MDGLLMFQSCTRRGQLVLPGIRFHFCSVLHSCFFQQRSQRTGWVMVLISAKSKDASGGISPGCCSPLPHAGTGRAAGIGAPGSIKGCQGLLWAEEMRLGSICLNIYPAKTSLVYTGCFLLLLFLLPLPFFIREPSSKQNIPK